MDVRWGGDQRASATCDDVAGRYSEHLHLRRMAADVESTIKQVVAPQPVRWGMIAYQIAIHLLAVMGLLFLWLIVQALK